MTEALHAALPPSSAHIWGSDGGCRAWVLMTAMHPERHDGEPAKVGRACHAISEQMIRADANPVKRPIDADSIIGTINNEGVFITEEMWEASRMYADEIISCMRSNAVFGGDGLGIEERVYMPAIHTKNWGTVDAYVYSQLKNTLYIFDAKFGYEIVNVFENLQLIDYYEGVREKLGLVDCEGLRVVFTIVQPNAPHRDGPVRTWFVDAVELRGYVNKLSYNAHEAMKMLPNCRTGKHCLHCSARHACDAALNMALSAIEYESQPVPFDLSPEAASLEYRLLLRARAAIELRITGRAESLLAGAREGQKLNGLRVEMGKGRQRWDVSETEVIALGKACGIDVQKEPKAITPKQAIKKGLPAEVVNCKSVTPTTGLKLVQDDGSLARHVFSKPPTT